MSASMDAPAPAAAKPKRSIFSSRPAWATPNDNAPAATRTADPDDDNIFSRTASSYQQIVRDAARQKERKAEKARAKAERKAQKEAKRRESVEGSARKKRRITDEDYARFGLTSPEKKQVAQDQNQDENEDEDVDTNQGYAMQASIRGPLPQTSTATTERDANPGATTTMLDDSEDDDDLAITASGPAKAPSPPPEEPDTDEELFPELVARARARRLAEDAAAQNKGAANGDTPQIFDPVLQILVSSSIPNTSPLLVRRKLSQRLKEVRQVWCERQGFDAEYSSKIFLTYKTRKLYDVTTCRSLGLEVSPDGRVINEEAEARRKEAKLWGGGNDDKDDPVDDGRVHIVAVTEEDLERQKREKERQNAISAGLEPEPESAAAPAEPPEEAEKTIRILLKAKGFKDYKLKVRPTTTCERIIAAFRREYRMSQDTKLTLMFDGDKLDASQEVEETEIEDMDCIEVHVDSE
ncbi:hypothetical protein MBLNU457_1923t1 [Dothideomycetes sp. NU457]